MAKIKSYGKLLLIWMALATILYWFGEFVLWLDHLLKVRTPLGTTIAYYGTHTLLQVIAVLGALLKWDGVEK